MKTNIVVRPGGSLVMKNNAHLTSARECSGQGMWDGVEPAAKAADILAGLTGLKLETGRALRLALHLATNDLGAARTLVNARRSAEPGNGYWVVQDLLVDHRERDLPLGQLSAGGQGLLHSVATAEKEGAPEALAWLHLLGQPFAPEFTLPHTTKSRQLQKDGASFLEHSPFLRAYPNPSNGPVYMVYSIPEGVEQAQLEVVHADGKLVFTRTIAPQNGIAELGPLPVGLNVATLSCDGIRLGVAKLSIVR